MPVRVSARRHAANFFLFPTDNFAYTGGGNDPHPNVRRMVRFMRANYPALWERNQARRARRPRPAPAGARTGRSASFPPPVGL